MMLFNEHGYDRTTAAEIAARVGVTERTFFRQFPDKREVLFDGEAVLRAALTKAIAEAPETLEPVDTMLHAFRITLPLLEAGRAFAEPRQALIDASPALQEREAAKLAKLTHALADALEERGVDRLQADLAARTGMTVFVQATLAWLADPHPPLGERLDLAARSVKELWSAAGG